MQIQNLTAVQRLAMRMITGCFRTTSTAALQHETDLLPIELELKKQVMKYLTRSQTLPAKHAIAIRLRRAMASASGSRFPSNLEHMIKKYPQYVITTMEVIHPHIQPPWQLRPNVTTHISRSDKEKAKEEHGKFLKQNESPHTLNIYTDGSGIDNGVGAAAYCPTTETSSQKHLGTADAVNVYAAELTGILLGIEMAERSSREYTNCYIYVDNQAAIQAIDKPRQQSGQYVIREIYRTLDTLLNERPNLTFSIRWVPGHMEIEGNDRADEEAKNAAAYGEASHQQSRPPIPPNTVTLKSVQVQKIISETKKAAAKEWDSGKATSQHLRQLSRRRFKTGTRIYGELPRKQAANLIRLRTGHCRLNSYLHRYKIVDDPQCDCGKGIETPKHFLLTCKKYEKQRDQLRKKIGGRNMRLGILLGNPKTTKATLEFVEETGRFNFE